MLVARAEVERAGRVEEVGVEDDDPVLAVRHLDAAGLLLGQEAAHRRLVLVVLGEVPVGRRLLVPDLQAAGLGLQVALVRRDPEVDVHRGEVGVHGNARQPAVVLEGPELAQGVVAEDPRQLEAQLLRDLVEQGRGEALVEEGAQVAVAVAVLVPEGRLQAEAPQLRQGRGRQEAVGEGDARRVARVVGLDLPGIQRRVHGAGRDRRRAFADDQPVVARLQRRQPLPRDVDHVGQRPGLGQGRQGVLVGPDRRLEGLRQLAARPEVAELLDVVGQLRGAGLVGDGVAAGRPARRAPDLRALVEGLEGLLDPPQVEQGVAEVAPGLVQPRVELDRPAEAAHRRVVGAEVPLHPAQVVVGQRLLRVEGHGGVQGPARGLRLALPGLQPAEVDQQVGVARRVPPGLLQHRDGLAGGLAPGQQGRQVHRRRRQGGLGRDQGPQRGFRLLPAPGMGQAARQVEARAGVVRRRRDHALQDRDAVLDRPALQQGDAAGEAGFRMLRRLLHEARRGLAGLGQPARVGEAPDRLDLRPQILLSFRHVPPRCVAGV